VLMINFCIKINEGKGTKNVSRLEYSHRLIFSFPEDYCWENHILHLHHFRGHISDHGIPNKNTDRKYP